MVRGIARDALFPLLKAGCERVTYLLSLGLEDKLLTEVLPLCLRVIIVDFISLFVFLVGQDHN